MEQILYFFAACACLYFLGFALLSFFRRVELLNSAERIGLPFLVGTAFMGISQHLIILFGIHMSFVSILATVLVVSVFGFLAGRSRPLVVEKASFSTGEKWCVAAMSILALFLFFGAFSTNSLGYDGTAFWGLKGKILYQTGTFYNEDFFDIARLHPHHRYPLFNPIMQSYLYHFLGGVDERFVRAFFALLFIASFFVMAGTLSRVAHRRVAILFTFLYALTPAFIHDAGGAITGYSDTPLAIFIFVATFYGYFYLREKEGLYLFLSVATMSAATLTKDEGMAYAVCLALSMFLAAKGNRVAALGWFFVPVLFGLSWMIATAALSKDAYYYPALLTPQNILEKIPRLPLILQYLFSELLALYHWGLMWVLFFVFLFAEIRQLKKTPWLFLLAPLLQTLVYLVIYTVFPEEDVHSLMRFNRMRLVMHLYPCILFWTAVCWGNRFSQEKDAVKRGRQ